MSKEILTVEETAELLSVKPKTVRQWVYQRRVPFFHIGRLLRFRLASILEWAAVLERAQAPAGDRSRGKKAAAQKPAAGKRKPVAARKG